MTVALRLESESEGEHVTHLCTNLGFYLLCDWIDSLPAGEYPAASAFAAAGAFAGTDVLADQLEAAFRASPPADPKVYQNVDRLLDLLGTGRPEETPSVE